MRQLFCFAFFAAVSLPVFAVTPTEVVSAYHVAVAHGETAKALSLLSPAVQIYESGHVEQSQGRVRRTSFAGRCRLREGHQQEGIEEQ